MSIAYLLLGSNLGTRTENLRRANVSINDLVGETLKSSFVYESPAWGFEHPSSFLNQAMKIKTRLSPNELLKEILKIEEALGRIRTKDTYESRTIDIDILLFDDLVVHQNNLILPHPRLHLRKFALIPLAELDPGLIHPIMGKTIEKLIDECPDESLVVKSTQLKESYKKEGCGNAV